MTYSNVPLTGQSLGITKNPINSNFALIQSAFSLNHYAVGSAGGSNSGKHMFVTMPPQSLSPGPSRAATENVLFSGIDPNAPSQTVLFSKTDSNRIYQLTKSIASQFPTFGTVNSGWTFLPGGIVMQYGIVTTPAPTALVSFGFPFPSGNPPFSIQLTAETNNNTSVASAGVANVPSPPTASGFYYYTNVGVNGSIYWTALGK